MHSDSMVVSAWQCTDCAMLPFPAAIASSKGPKNGKLYTEDDWNETATLEESPYLLSKVTSCSQNKHLWVAGLCVCTRLQSHAVSARCHQHMMPRCSANRTACRLDQLCHGDGSTSDHDLTWYCNPFRKCLLQRPG